MDFVNTLEKDNAHRSNVAMVPTEWLDEKRRYVLSTLRHPREEDIAVMVSTVVTFSDGLAFIRDT